MVIVYDAAVRADRHIYAGFQVIFIARRGNLDQRGRLTAADALLLAGNADRAAADADLDKVRARVREEAEAFPIDDVARADLDRVAIILAHPRERTALPLGKALGGIDAQHIRAGLDQSGYALGIIAGINARAHNIALMLVKQFERICLVAVIVLAEHQINKMLLLIHQRERIKLMIPYDIVGDLERGVRRRGNQLFKRGHELGHLHVGFHTGNAVIAAGDDAEQSAGSRAVVRDRNGGVAGPRFQVEDIRQRLIRLDVGIGYDKAGLVAFDAGHHRGLALDGLRAVNKGNAALLRKRDRHAVVRNRLHDGRNHRDVRIQGGLLSFSELDDRGAEADVRWNTFRGRITGYEQVFVERVRRLAKIIRHTFSSPFSFLFFQIVYCFLLYPFYQVK